MSDLLKYLLIALIVINISCRNRDKNRELKDPYGNTTYFSNDFQSLYESISEDFESDSAAKLYVKATLFLRDNDLDSAKRYMIESYKIECTNKMLLKDLGIIFNHLNQLDSAKKYLRKSIMIDSTYSLALSSLGLTYYSQDSDLIAIEYYDKALEYDSENGAFYLNKALAYQQLGYMDSCCENLKIAQKYGSFNTGDYIRKLIDEYECESNN